MKIHHASNTRSVRAIWLMEELGLPYDVEKYKLGDPAMRSPDYLKVHPMGRVPALEDGDVGDPLDLLQLVRRLQPGDARAQDRDALHVGERESLRGVAVGEGEPHDERRCACACVC